MKTLLTEIRSCTHCAANLEFGVKPIVAASTSSKIVVIGQAPGSKVHQSGVPWADKSGDNLRSWMGLTKDEFYNTELVALIPMGFCYPGKGKSGDLPPRPECAPLWHNKLLSSISNIKLILLIGLYAQNYYLKDKCEETLTETVRQFHNYGPIYFPLPHPSPRNNIWQAKNDWFKLTVLPELQSIVKQAIKAD